MAIRSARDRRARRAALALAAGLAGAQDAEEPAAGAPSDSRRDAREERALAAPPEALLELPYVYPLLPMRPPPAPR